jgi:CRISPR/Cas system-associated endonuclease Cas1
VEVPDGDSRAPRIFLKDYFKQFPDEFRPKKRSKYGAKDPLNNLLNLGYEVLKREIILAILPMHLGPYLGFLLLLQIQAVPSL